MSGTTNLPLGVAIAGQPAMVHSPFCTLARARLLCACGENVSCSTCGWGNGAYPCRCTRERLALMPPPIYG